MLKTSGLAIFEFICITTDSALFRFKNIRLIIKWEHKKTLILGRSPEYYHELCFLMTIKHTAMSIHKSVKKVTTHVLNEMKLKHEKIAMLTAYDYSMARILDQAGIDVILVGDSASNVMAGHDTTVPITLNEMIYHASGVVRGVKRALVVVDLPFGTYQGNSKEALSSAIRIMKETGASAVKMEGGSEIRESVVQNPECRYTGNGSPGPYPAVYS